MANAPTPSQAATPKNAVVILLDSLNRHMLGAYGGREFETPNLDAFAETAIRFDNHHTGSLRLMQLPFGQVSTPKKSVMSSGVQSSSISPATSK